MADDGIETFTERFVRLTAGMSRKQIGRLLDLTETAVKKIQEGDTQSLKAHGAIALARALGVSVEYLAERGPLPRDERAASVRIFATGLTPTAASDETEALGPSLGALQLSVERALETLGNMEDRLAKLENVRAEATGTPHKGA